MAEWIMTIDINKCENCNNCFLACKDEHYDNDWPPYSLAQPRHGHRWMNIHKNEQGTFPHIGVSYMPRPCFHCADPPCVKKASNGEIYKRPDGIVIVDPERSKGREDLVQACPHRAIWWNSENQTPQKCTLCAHLLDGGWQQPRCTQTCPTGALTFQKHVGDDLQAHIRLNGLKRIDHPETELSLKGPVVFYKNLDTFNSCFIAGSVATGEHGVQDCIEGETVALYRDGVLIGREKTDAFGDFRFSCLPGKSNAYEIKVGGKEKEPVRRQVHLPPSCSVGTIWV